MNYALIAGPTRPAPATPWEKSVLARATHPLLDSQMTSGGLDQQHWLIRMVLAQFSDVESALRGKMGEAITGGYKKKGGLGVVKARRDALIWLGSTCEDPFSLLWCLEVLRVFGGIAEFSQEQLIEWGFERYRSGSAGPTRKKSLPMRQKWYKMEDRGRLHARDASYRKKQRSIKNVRHMGNGNAEAGP